jgi:hypothetical protein
MFAALRFEFDDDGDCQWSALNGTYFFTDLAGGCSEGTDAFWRSDGVSLVLSALWAAARGDCANSTCLDDSGPGFSFFGITANCSPEGFQIEFGAACDDDTTTDPTGSLLLTIPTEVTHGVEFEFDSVSVPGTAFISFWGKPCTGPDTCGDGPETDFSSSGAGCTKTITPTDTPGRCPILWWFDNLGNTGTTSAAYSVNRKSSVRL